MASKILVAHASRHRLDAELEETARVGGLFGDALKPREPTLLPGEPVACTQRARVWDAICRWARNVPTKFTLVAV